MATSYVFVPDADATTPQAELERIAPGLQAQLREDVSPEWDGAGADAVFRTDAATNPPQPGECQIQGHAKAPQSEQDALAYHAVADDGVTPIIHYFEDLIAQTGVSISSVVSHETCEETGDPDCQRTATLPDGRVVAVELCDQVEAQSYDKNGVQVSNWNRKSNFGIGGNDAPYDFLGNQTSQFQCMPGGYEQVLDPTNGWQQITADGGMAAYRAHLARVAPHLTRHGRRKHKHAHHAETLP